MVEASQTAVRRWREAGAAAGMIYDPRRVAGEATLLDPAASQTAAQPVGQGGRQAAWFVQTAGGPAVLRFYRRGGAVARLSRDRYLWLGEARSRGFAEFRLMQSLADQGLPVPAPLAAAYWRSGLCYRAALLTCRVAGAVALATCPAGPAWAEAGRAIAALHGAGVWHADLNAHNILLDPAGRAWIIDLDRSWQGRLHARHRQANLDRLQRSLRKLRVTAAGEGWPQLLQAYQAALQV